MTPEMAVKREEMENWQNFCKSKIDKIEKVWNRKLEDTAESEDDN